MKNEEEEKDLELRIRMKWNKQGWTQKERFSKFCFVLGQKKNKVIVKLVQSCLAIKRV